MTRPDFIRATISEAEVEALRERANQITFEDFSRANLARCVAPDGFRHPLDSWSLSDWFLAAVGELGEAANVAKKLNRCRDGIAGNKETEDDLRAKLRREIGDTGVYLDLLCQYLGFSLLDAMIEVFNRKSAEIGYPVELRASRTDAGGQP